MKTRFALGLAILLAIAGISAVSYAASPRPELRPPMYMEEEPVIPLADDPSQPVSPVKLIFIHHSTGGNWLADIGEHDQAGGLGQALMDNNYFVSATNYQWGPRSDPGDPDSAIGSRTDIPNWPEWFTDTIMSAVYTETGQNIGGFGDWSRMADPNPGSENEIIMFKSCFPNSDLYGNPGDPPLSEPDDSYTVANAKAVYNRILEYSITQQDKLFIVITAPPMAEGEYAVNDPGTPAADRAANARAFNNWLVHDWLATNNYTYTNVAVFDYYNVLTSNGSPTRIDDTSVITEPNDFDMRPDGNHHYWNGSEITHTQSISNNFSAYPSYSGGIDDYYDSHPMSAGQQKATHEFVQMLNVLYNRWKSGTIVAPTLNFTSPSGGEEWPVSSTQQIRWNTTGVVTQVNLAFAVDGLTTTIETNVDNTGAYNWTTPPTPTTSARVRVESVVSPTTVYDVSDPFTLYEPGDYTVHIPLVLRNYSTMPSSGSLVQPGDLAYQGAFRLPDMSPATPYTLTWAYGGEALTYYPDGDADGPDDGYPGSLFGAGHEALQAIGEVSIPEPLISAGKHVTELNAADTLQDFYDVKSDVFPPDYYWELPQSGLAYLPRQGAQTTDKLYFSMANHAPGEDYDTGPTHGWCELDLSDPQVAGIWSIGGYKKYVTADYMFEIPKTWADTHTSGQYLGTGRFRDGGQGALGPSLLATAPWAAGNPPISGTVIAATPLLLYQSIYDTDPASIDGYQEPDEWEGGAWITTGSGKAAVLFAGTKSNGTKYWYGYINPAGPEFPCVEEGETSMVTCRLADGSPCTDPQDFVECEDHTSAKGWWSSNFDAEFILYDPADLAQVAAGEIESWELQPYVVVDIDDYLFLPLVSDPDSLGTGVQRRHRIGSVAYDRDSNLLYVVEPLADEDKPLVHVWKVN